MSFRGTLNKFGFLFIMVMATAFYVWNEAAVGNSIQGYVMGGAIGGLVVALILMFKPVWAQYLAPAYALLEGLVIGSISAIYNNAFAKVAPGIVMQAVILTFGTAIAM
ncbi:MAG: Bax inhibitor-1/YccA family protein, partial [Chitinophagaceae bacterium]|nr:Bax inhibitor-1/YccA family protein [Chitinophagaceae bacterium]MCE2758734.1 Bax inhibitor-1/YccA family protein [Chitinophagaceae bacterium]